MDDGKAVKKEPKFSVISGKVVRKVLEGAEVSTVALIENAYLTHGAGRSVNPPSYFLRFQDKPDARIIALPASLGGNFEVDGIKWISSFPENIKSGLPRASAVLVLNDHETGYPFACIESSIISATRTAASAALAAARLSSGRARPRSVTFFGTGLIARYVHRYLSATGWDFDSITIYDLNSDYSELFSNSIRDAESDAEIRIAVTAEDAIRSSDLIVFATTAATPHVSEASWFAHHPIVLHLSLRDLSPEIILSSINVVDDIEHCLKASTSPHLAQQLSGSHDFIYATLAELIEKNIDLPEGKPMVFSPFGLGILDLAVGVRVHAQAVEEGLAVHVDSFFAELDRYVESEDDA